MAGRAFWTEDYMRPLGEDPIELYATVQDVYLGMDICAEGSRHAAAPSPATTSSASPASPLPAHCFFCGMDPDAEAPATTAPARCTSTGSTWRSGELHTGLPPHANIGPVAVEPTLQGKGIGAEARRGRVRTGGGAITPRRWRWTATRGCSSFYEGPGSGPIARVTDPWGFDIVGLRREPEPA